ncbi:SRPBCC family protein [Chelatococcus reniformis]|uniref:Vanillate O-demethylase oxidoreductase VanB n=1 Tax=Chelatococcus reniformis TaxID=1494448 RepID=A0A916UUM7_9HYPH|nr:SRPBCC family protein [Chelatococcus reniformis]GGC88476.1 vanillate O-demethylase oxidoreductase VanB [Chelatococcus reniformis]
MSDRIEKTIVLNAPIERVWRALTDHTEFGTWFRVQLDGPFMLGEISTGTMTYPGYEHVSWRATVTDMEAPRLFAFTWPHPADIHTQDQSQDQSHVQSPDPITRVEFRLETAETGTRLTIVESGFDALPVDRRADAMRRNDEGWTEQAGNIRAHVQG